jgi:hypothetical protein
MKTWAIISSVIWDFKKNLRRETGFNVIAGSGTNKKIKARCGKVTYDLAGYGIYIIYISTKLAAEF